MEAAPTLCRRFPALLLLLAVLTVAGCRREAAHSPGDSTRIRIVFTGGMRGEIERCECDGGKVGGLAARGTYLQRHPNPQLLLDAGAFGFGASDADLPRWQLIVQAMEKLGYSAANLGSEEALLGAERLDTLARLGVPLVSANLLRTDGSPLAPTHLVREIDGLRVVVTGVVDAEFAGPGLTIRPPAEALAELLPALTEAGDLLIVLADLPPGKATDLTRRFPEIDLLLRRGGGESQLPSREHRSLVAAVADRGHYLVDLTLCRENAAWYATGEAVFLDSAYPDDPNLHDWLQAHHDSPLAP